ncbi:FMRFamide receptor [Biomphalaria glabrata]|nr:FMRFamide receptor [Biomphalaria glabrata]
MSSLNASFNTTSISNISSISTSTLYDLLLIIFNSINLFACAQVVGVFGIVANILNIRLFRKQGYQDGVNITLTALALSDIGALVNMLVYITMLNPLIDENGVTVSKGAIGYVSFFLHEYFIKVSSLIITFAAVERCLCVALPLKVKRMITAKLAIAVNGVIFIVMCLYLFVHFHIMFLSWDLLPETNQTVLRFHYKSIRVMYLPTAYYATDIFLPYCTFLVLISCSAIIFVKLKSKSKWRQSNSSWGDKSVSLMYKERKTAKLFMLVSVTCVVLLLPYYLMFTCTAFMRELAFDGAQSVIGFLVSSFTIQLETINCSITLFIYYDMSSKFRAEFRKMFGQWSKLNIRKTRQLEYFTSSADKTK